MKLENIKYTKICAFCRNWYDPTNSCIHPKHPESGFWEFDNTAVNKCVITGFKKQSWSSCRKFEKKV